MSGASQSAFGSSFKNSLPRHFGGESEAIVMGATVVGTAARGIAALEVRSSRQARNAK